MTEEIVGEVATATPGPVTRSLANVAGFATRPLRYRGLGVLTAALTKRAASDTLRVTVRGQPLLIPAGDPYWSRLLASGYEYEPDLWRVVDQAQFGFDLLDVGANIGYWSAAIARRDPAARVVAVEPNPATTALLRQNVPASVAVIEGAAVARPVSHVELSVAGGGVSDAAATIAPDARHGTRTVTVPAVEIRGLLERFADRDRPLMVKLDVEGIEAELLDVVLPAVGPRTLVIYEDHGRDVSHAATAAALRHGWELGLLTARGAHRIRGGGQLSALKSRTDVGYNVCAVDPQGPWAFVTTTPPG